ncbi:cell division transport system permease protein [Fusobacterium naviforme]|nr:ABC transporter permease [Fusobacterium naviforme]PSL11169.1 cell division transport system permease protein [Fusobacterium naviforme]STO28544.1 Cell division protein FtsX [Fusobacterium naviforme]
MNFSMFAYCLKQGMKNICRNLKFSLASAATVSACIFLFCMFFAIVRNLDYVVRNAESSMGVTALFEETLSEEEIRAIGAEISARPEVRELSFISAEEAWEQFKSEYFAGKEELAAGFNEDNPLAGSASYNILLNDISEQDAFVAWLSTVPGVRQVNYARSTVSSLMRLNRVITLLSGGIILILLMVAVFLIANTITVAAAFRRTENEIMRMIGATNGMIRAPFVIEGTVIGLVGALLPLGAVSIFYGRVVGYLTERFGLLTDIFRFLPLRAIFPQMAGTALLLGCGIGFGVSFLTIRKHLRV